MITEEIERFRPPPHSAAPQTGRDRLVLILRRLIDLQFGTIWRDMADILPSLSGTVADVGCGAQPFRGLLPPTVRYIGVDIAASDEQFGYRAPDTRYYVGDVLPLADGEADAVLCTETLEHVLQPQAFLRELHRCLKPSGTLVLSVPFSARWHFVPHDYWRYTPSGLDYLLTGAGFAETIVYARGGAVTVACYKVMGCILPLAVSRRAGGLRWLDTAVAMLSSPLLVVAATTANLALLFYEEGADCLGYTIVTKRHGVAEQPVQHS